MLFRNLANLLNEKFARLYHEKMNAELCLSSPFVHKDTMKETTDGRREPDRRH